jgi:hypothetical protein
MFVTSGGPTAWASTEDSTPLPSTIKGESYFTHCDGLLEAVVTEDIEGFFIRQVQTPGQALKLLFDYGLTHSAELNEALMLTLQNRGVKVRNGLQKNQVRFARGVVGIAELPESRFQIFIKEFQANIVKVINMGNGRDKNQIQSLAITRLLTSMQKQSNPILDRVLATYIKAVLVGSARSILNSALEDLRDNPYGLTDQIGVSVVIGIVSGLATLFLAATATDWRGDDPNNFFKVQEFYASLILGPLATLGLFHYKLNRKKIKRWFVNRLPTVPGFQVASDNGQKMYSVPNFTVRAEPGETIAIKIDQICAATTSVCAWSPVQLAYLVYLDMLEIQAMGEAIQTTLQTVGDVSSLHEIRAAAEELRADPGNLPKQLKFRGLVVSAFQGILRAEESVRKSLDFLSERTQAVKSHLVEARDRLFAFSADQYSADLIHKSQLLATKLQTDLASLAEIQTHQEQIVERFQQLQPLLERLSSAVPGAYRPADEWREVASQALVVLGALESSEARETLQQPVAQ